jgi:hypothetical protein
VSPCKKHQGVAGFTTGAVSAKRSKCIGGLEEDQCACIYEFEKRTDPILRLEEAIDAARVPFSLILDETR